jgi:hypothetical protein
MLLFVLLFVGEERRVASCSWRVHERRISEMVKKVRLSWKMKK